MLFLIPTLLAGAALMVTLANWQSDTSVGGVGASSELVAMREKVSTLQDQVEKLRWALEEQDATLPALPRDRQLAEQLPDLDELISDRLSSLERKLDSLPSAKELEIAAARDVPAGTVSDVKRALEVIRDEERQQEEQQRIEREEQRIRDRVERLAGDLNLSNAQMDDMNRILMQEAEARRALFAGLGGNGGRGGRGGFGGGDRNAMREQMDLIRQTRDQELAKTLDAWQLEEYQKQDDRGFGRGRGGRNNDNNSNDSGNNAGGGGRGGRGGRGGD
ncbi:MAG: hypothetical protein RL885_04710 [Planctomycetota bacterium]